MHQTDTLFGIVNPAEGRTLTAEESTQATATLGSLKKRFMEPGELSRPIEEKLVSARDALSSCESKINEKLSTVNIRIASEKAVVATSGSAAAGGVSGGVISVAAITALTANSAAAVFTGSATALVIGSLAFPPLAVVAGGAVLGCVLVGGIALAINLIYKSFNRKSKDYLNKLLSCIEEIKAYQIALGKLWGDTCSSYRGANHFIELLADAVENHAALLSRASTIEKVKTKLSSYQGYLLELAQFDALALEGGKYLKVKS
jgi:hypothetical protein